jgi:AraC-like DNA-binding protein
MDPHRLTADQNTATNLCVISFACNSEAIYRLRDTAYKLTPHEKRLITKMFEEAEKTFELPKLDPYLKKMRTKSEVPIGSLQIIQLALEELVIRLLRKGSAKNHQTPHPLTHYDDELINNVIRHLRDNLSGSLTLSELAKKVGYGKTALCTRFKAVTGQTIFHFLTQLRVEEAKRMIRNNGSITTSAISDALGFSDPAYFCNVFKRVTGMSPKEYSRMIHAFDKVQ